MAARTVLSRSEKCATRRRPNRGFQTRTFLWLVLETGIVGDPYSFAVLIVETMGLFTLRRWLQLPHHEGLVFHVPHWASFIWPPTSVRRLRKGFQNPMALVAVVPDGFSNSFSGCDRGFCARSLSGVFPHLEAAVAQGIDGRPCRTGERQRCLTVLYRSFKYYAAAVSRRVVDAYLNTNDRAAIRYMAGQPGR